MRWIALFIIISMCWARPTFASLDIPGIEHALNARGRWIANEKVYKLTFPRDDIKPTLAGAAIPSSIVPTTWISFMSGHEQMVMLSGEIVVLANEINPVIDAAIDHGLDVTALHSAMIDLEPNIYVLEIGGEGSAENLAKGAHAVLDALKSARSASPSADHPALNFPETSSISAQAMDGILGPSIGNTNSGVYEFAAGRVVTMPCACRAGLSMGVNTSARFVGSDDRAIVVGQFACAYGELQPTLKSLRSHGMQITAIGNHMEAEAPRLIYVQFQKIGRAVDLARAIKAALDAQTRNPAGGRAP